MLGELILYRPQIELKSLENKLNEKFPNNNLPKEKVWDILVKNNWVMEYNLGEG